MHPLAVQYSSEALIRVRSVHGSSGSRASRAAQRHQATDRGTPEAIGAESESPRSEAETKACQAFRLGPRLARFGLVQWRRCYFSGDLSPRQTLADDLTHRQVKPVAVSQLIPVLILPIVEAKHLLIHVGLQVCGINRNVGSFQP